MALGIPPFASALLVGLMIGPFAVPKHVSPSGPVSDATSDPAPTNTQVLLLTLVFQGTISDHAKAEFDAQIRTGLVHDNIEIIRAADECSDDVCMRDAALELGASHAIVITIVSGGRDFRADLRVLPVVDDRANFATNIDCPVCGVDEVGIQLAGKARAIRDWVIADGAWARLRLSGTPSHAEVYIDGERAGDLPYSGELGLGDHEIVVRAPGYHDKRIPFTAITGSVVELSVALVFERVEADATPRWKAPVGGVMTGLGAIGLVTGATFIALDGRPIASRCKDQVNIDADGDCKYQYTSTPAGLGLMLGGAALASVGVALLVIGVRHETQAGRRIGVEVGLDRLMLQVEF